MIGSGEDTIDAMTGTRRDGDRARRLGAWLLLCLLPYAGAANAEPLGRFFSAPETREAERYRRDFAAAATAGDVAELYRQALALEQRLLAPIRDRHQVQSWPLLDSFRDAELGLPGLAPACAAECSEPAFSLVLPDFAAAASKTLGKADDAWFRLLGEFLPYAAVFDGKLTGWPVFFKQTWDYGGYSLLGDGSHLALLLRIDAFVPEHQLFAREVGELRDRLLSDLFEGSSCSGLARTDILEEIGEIQSQVRLSTAEAEKLARRHQAFQDPARHGIEVDCRRPVCSCGHG